jgi:putative glycosyltransferase
MKLSIVTTLYNSEPYIRPFYERAVAAAKAITDDFEIVMVDDGSPDNSLELAIDIANADPHVRIVELSRNFGHHRALMTGLDHAQGDLCFLIDSDLEEDPALLLEFHEKLRDEDFDVVYGYQAERKGGWFERLSGRLSYALLDRLIPYRIPRNHITVRLMKRSYVKSLLLHREQQTVIGGLWVITGFRQLGLPVEKLSRGGTTYGFRKRWWALIDSVTSFSETPLVMIFYLGMVICGVSALIGIYLLFQRIFIRTEYDGWVSIMLSIWFIGGLLIFCVGLIGIYISKIFIETKRRPYTIVRSIHSSEQSSPRLGAGHD